jgi:hypothetical protein
LSPIFSSEASTLGAFFSSVTGLIVARLAVPVEEVWRSPSSVLPQEVREKRSIVPTREERINGCFI